MDTLPPILYSYIPSFSNAGILDALILIMTSVQNIKLCVVSEYYKISLMEIFLRMNIHKKNHNCTRYKIQDTRCIFRHQ